MNPKLSPSHSMPRNLLVLFLPLTLLFSHALVAQPLNDDCDGIVEMGEAPICPFAGTFNNVDATLSMAFTNPADNIPTCFNGEPERDVWFSFVVPANGSILDFQIEIEGVNGPNGSIQQPQVAIYRGDCFLDELQELACASAAAGETRVELDITGLTPGLTYFLRVNDWSDNPDPNWGDFEVCVKEPPLTPDDLPWDPDPVCESIITTGIAAVTCGVSANLPPDELWTFGMLNINDVLPASGRVDVTADVEMYHHPSWHVDSIGNVFGVTMDYSGNTYITASSNYGAGFFGVPGIVRYGDIGGGSENVDAAGTVYLIDGASGQASVFAVLPQQVGTFNQVNCEGIENVTRNTGPALGNLVFSPATKQFYVTNFEDGRIYRLDKDGNILDSYDPFDYDDGAPGTPELNELAYGVTVKPDGSELFFGTPGSAEIGFDLPRVYSILLNPDGSFVGSVDNTTLPSGATYDNFVGTETFHFSVIPGSLFIGNMQSISDLEFTPDDKLLVGVRTGCQLSIHNSYNHGGQALVLSQSPAGLYENMDGIIYTGYPGSLGGSSESYGGVSVFNSPDGTIQYTISSADILEEFGPHGICIVEEGVFGVTGAPAEPAGAVSYAPLPIFEDPKGIGGDIKVFEACMPEEDSCAVANFEVLNPGCDSLTVSPNNLSMGATQYEWYFNDPGNPGVFSGDENPNYTYSDFGTYDIMLVAFDDSLCSDTLVLPVTLTPNSLSPEFDIQVIQCSDSILVQITDLSSDTLSSITSWEWVLSTPSTTITFEGQGPHSIAVGETGPATLTLTIENELGCSAALTEQFLIKNSPPVLDLGPDLDVCGTLNLELDAGTGFLEYLWNTNETTQSIMVNSSGTYSVSATDACGEIQVDEITISIDTVELTLPDSVVLCLGESFTFDVPGFIGYEWSPSDFLSCTDCPDPTTTPTSSISYQLTAISPDSCVAMGSTDVIVLPTFQDSLEFEICEDETFEYDGVELEPGTVTDFAFTASNGCDSLVTVTIIGLPNVETAETISICFGETADIFGTPTDVAGEYSMVFPASNSCDSTHIITLIVYDEIDLQTSSTDATCFGASNGSASASASGGTEPFAYEWSTGDMGPEITGQPAGGYSVTATDINGCTAEANIIIGQPSELTVMATGQNVTCDELGFASANAEGGTPGYSYEWNTGDTGADIFDLDAGIYTVTVTDQNGCSAEASVEIMGALGPEVSISIDQLPTEDEPESGALTAIVSGGSAPFEVEWSNGDTELSIDSLSSGEYSVTITDANGCTATAVEYIYLPGCTGGKIWNDRNRDGCQMGGELGLGGIELELTGTDIWGNDINLTTTTAINGEYIFEPLPPGDYQVFLPVPPDYQLSPMDNCADDFVDSDFNSSGLSFVVDLAEGHCCLIVDGGLYDACLNVYDPGVICCDQIVCGPGVVPAPITSLSPAVGAAGAIEYMWMYSLNGPSFSNGTWMGIPGTNSPEYQPGPLSQTTYFARCVRAIGCEEWLETNVVEVFVDDVAVAQIDGPNSVCLGDLATYFAVDNGPDAAYEWNFGPWANPQTASGQNVEVTWLQTGIVYINLTVSSNGCTSTDTYGLAISDSPVYCTNNLGAPNGSIDNGPRKKAFNGTLTFTTFPNPVTEVVTVSWDEMRDGQFDIELMSLDGKKILKGLGNGQVLSYQVDLTHVLPGMYFIRVKYGEGEQQLFKIVKQ